MKKKKWILPVCITCSFVVLCLVAVFVITYVMSVQGYGISTGRLYFDDNYTFLIDENDMAMIVSDCSKDKKMYEGYQSGDKVLIIHDGVETSYPSRTGGYHIFRLSKGDGSYKPADVEEGSGSIRHKVEKAGVVDEELVICIDSIVPEAGTCDTAITIPLAFAVQGLKRRKSRLANTRHIKALMIIEKRGILSVSWECRALMLC